MAFRPQELKPDKPREQERNLIGRLYIVFLLLLLFSSVIFLVILLSIQKIISSFWLEFFAAICFILSLPLFYLQGFFSHTTSKPEVSMSLPFTSREEKLRVPSLQMLALQTTLVNETTFRRIRGVPPPTNPKFILQRDEVVKDLYAKLTQSQISALILVGIAGCGKSILAALLSKFLEEQPVVSSKAFPKEAIWLTVDKATTMLDLAGTIFEALDTPFTDFNRLTSKEQARTLFEVLNDHNNARFVILDQFDNLLDWQTGHILANHSAISEWLDLLKERSSLSRILITSRSKPKAAHKPLVVPTFEHLIEHPILGLKTVEGIELLRKQGMKASEEELSEVVNSCEGHPLSLTLFSSILRRFNCFNIKDFSYTSLWKGNIAHNLLDSIYKKQLNAVQRRLLLALSIYREPVSLDAACILMDFNPELAMVKLQLALEALLTQHLIQPSSSEPEKLYRPHSIISSYVLDHFVDDNELAIQQALHFAHAKAAQYYQVNRKCPPREHRLQISDVHPIIEAVWHWCQAEQWDKAFELMEQEGLFVDLKLWGGNILLLELSKLFLSTDKPHLDRLQTAKLYNTLGEIYRILGQIKQSEDYLKQALLIFQEEGDQLGEGWTLHNLGRLYADIGEERQAKLYLILALKIRREGKYRKGEGRTLNNLGRVYSLSGQIDEAEKYIEEALNISREVEDQKGERNALTNLSKIRKEEQHTELALYYLELALKKSEKAGDRLAQGWMLHNLGRLYADLGRKEEAEKCFKRALLLRKEVSDRRGEGWTLHNIGRINLEKRCYDLALACFLLAKDILAEVESPDRGQPQFAIKELAEKVGEKQFTVLLAQVEPKALQIVEQAFFGKNSNNTTN